MVINKIIVKEWQPHSNPIITDIILPFEGKLDWGYYSCQLYHNDKLIYEISGREAKRLRFESVYDILSWIEIDNLRNIEIDNNSAKVVSDNGKQTLYLNIEPFDAEVKKIYEFLTFFESDNKVIKQLKVSTKFNWRMKDSWKTLLLIKDGLCELQYLRPEFVSIFELYLKELIGLEQKIWGLINDLPEKIVIRL